MIFVLLAVVVVILKLNKDPFEYIAKAEIALAQAETLIKDYDAKADYSEEAIEAVEEALKEVRRNYGAAAGCANDDEQRVELLFILADLHAMDNKFYSPDWSKIHGYWNGIITINPKNIKARGEQLNYFYDQQMSIVALMPGGNSSLWVRIEKLVVELIDVMKEQDIPVTPYLLKIRAWATLEIADVEKYPEKYVVEAIKQFEELLEIDPGDVEIYELLSQAYLKQGEIKRNLGLTSAFDKARVKQEEIVQLSIEKAKDKAKANVNWLNIRFFKTVGALNPLRMGLGGSLRDMKQVKALEKTLASLKNSKNTGDLKDKLKIAKAAVARNKKQLQNELVALSAAFPLTSEIQETFSDFLMMSDPEVFLTEGKKIIKLIESQLFQPFKDEYIALSAKYPSSPDVHAAFSRSLGVAELFNIDGQIEEMSKAIALDKENAIYAIGLSELFFKKAIVESDASSLEAGIKIAENALGFPDVSVEAGPNEEAARHYRWLIYQYLAKSHIERSMIAQAENDDARSERSISDAKAAIHEIKQFKKENEFVKRKWDGLLAMVEGDKITAISNLYYAQKLLKATETVDSDVSYFLSKLLEGRTEIGSRVEFLSDALINKFGSSNYVSIASTRPDALLEYAELLLQMKQYPNAKEVVENVFVGKYGSNDRSKSILVICDLSEGNFVGAENKLSKMDPESTRTASLRLKLLSTHLSALTLQLSALDPEADDYKADTESLKKEIKQLQTQRFMVARKLIKIGLPEFAFPSGICGQLFRDGETEKAFELIDSYIAAAENNADALFYKAIFAQPDPLNVPGEKQNEIRERILNDTPDELRRHVLLGRFYFSAGQNEKSLAEYKAALKIDPDNTDAVGGFFDAALKLDDFDAASAILTTVKKNNIDSCGGEFFIARIDIAKKLYDSAIKRIDVCLEIRPILPYAYILKSQIYAAKGEYEEAVRNAKAAASINSLDGIVAKQVVLAIEARNIALGIKVTETHREEMKTALVRAVFLNPNEWQIQSLLARFISESDPVAAISIQQKLAKRVPTVGNFILLGNMARDLADRTINKAVKQALFDIAEPAFEKAYAMAPKVDAVVDAYCDFLRLTGKHDEAVKILEDREELLWVFHLRDSQFEKAKAILIKLHQSDPKNEKVLRGLMRTCKETLDKEGLIKYSQDLLSINKNVGNELLQIQLYLDAGLVSESTSLLGSFRTKYPDERRGRLLESWSAMSNGKLEIALKLIDKYLAIDPDNAIAWRLRGQIHSIGGDYDKAIQDLDKSRRIDDNSIIQIELAKVYTRSGDTERAIGVLSSALKDDRAPMRMMNMLEQLYTKSGRKTDLIAFYKKTLEKYPESINWHFRAGRFSLIEGEFYDAEKYFLTAMELGKGSKSIFVILEGYLQAIMSSRQYQRAIDVAAKYIDTKYAPVAYLNMAKAEDKLDRRKKTLEYFYKAIEASGENNLFVLKILNNMSNVIGVEEVEKWCKNELARDSNSFAANRMMSTIMASKQQFDEAIAYVDNCLKGLPPDSGGHLDMLAIKANIAVGAYMRNASDKYLDIAIKANTLMLSKNPNNPGVLNNLAYFFAKTGTNIDKAVEYGKRAYKVSPNDSNVIDTYAFTLCKSGQHKKAKELLHSAIGIIEKNSIELPWDLVNHLGMAHEGLSEMQEAKDNYIKALELAGDALSAKDKEELVAAVARVSN